MSDIPIEQWVPTLFFEQRNDRLHQLWVQAGGKTEWRPVPVVNIDEPKRKPVVVGFYDDDD